MALKISVPALVVFSLWTLLPASLLALDESGRGGRERFAITSKALPAGQTVACSDQEKGQPRGLKPDKKELQEKTIEALSGKKAEASRRQRSKAGAARMSAEAKAFLQFFTKGLQHGRDKSYEQAIADYTAAISLCQDDAAVYYNRGSRLL